MKKINGKISLAGNLTAFSSNLFMRSRRSSSATARSASPRGVPYCRLCPSMVPNRRIPSPPDRALRLAKASRRVRIRRSLRKFVNTLDVTGLDRCISWDTRSNALSNPMPASLHTTSKSSASGVPPSKAAAWRRE